MPTEPIPALINCRAGSAAELGRRLREDPRFRAQDVEPAALAPAVRAAVERGARRIVVCGGDGSIASAAAVLAGSGIELAIVPGGTLNHFARDHGIPTDASAALDVAVRGVPRGVDVGFVNDRIFLNTSSVGAYVSFVRRRERLERWMGYRSASFLAGLQILAAMRTYSLGIETARQARYYRGPLVFVAVNERELAAPALGSRRPDGRRGLHALAVKGRARARLFILALAAMAGGVRTAVRLPHLESFLVECCTVELPGRRSARVALDGELVRLALPLRYRFAPAALTVLVPE